jgi:hypothetical protein
MVVGADQLHPVFQDRPCIELAARRRRHADAEFHALGRDQRQELVWRAIVENQFDIGIAPAEPARGRRQQRHRGAGRCGEADPTAIALGKVTEGAAERGDILQDALGNTERLFRGSGRDQRPGRTIEQPAIQRLFDLANENADSRLRDAQLFRRRGELSKTVYGNEGP